MQADTEQWVYKNLQFLFYVVVYLYTDQQMYYKPGYQTYSLITRMWTKATDAKHSHTKMELNIY
jgi:hypothetical protein